MAVHSRHEGWYRQDARIRPKALVGGSSKGRSGLAHNGVLFLDEWPIIAPL
jgi:predicted ATPase with chaperone activity